MEKKTPSVLQIGVIAAFVLSCFGLALFLWITFGGPTPLRAESYQIKVPFDEATQLADQADVRISGVNVGRVTELDLPPGGGLAIATLSIEPDYAPLPADIRAVLRTKTLLGETYVELTPGTEDGPKLPEGATLPEAQVADTVQLDEILRTFDPETRNAFRIWMRDSSIAIDKRSRSLSNALAMLPDTFAGFERVFRTLDTQHQAVTQLFSNGAETFAALSERSGQLRSLIETSNRVLETTAARDQQIIDLFRVFPTFLTESRQTLADLRGFALNADPLMQDLVPVARELSPFLQELGRLAPQLRGLFIGLRPVIDNARRAFPAFRRLFRDDFPPLLRALHPFLRNLNPIIDVIRAYRGELTALLGNAASMSNGKTTVTALGRNVRYLRTEPALGPGALATFPRRLKVSRGNAYTVPGIYAELAKGLPSFETRQCAGGITAALDPDTPNDPAFNARVGGDVAEAEDLFNRLKLYAFGDSLSSDAIPAPPCRQQQPFGPFGAPGQPTAYPHTLEQPAP